MTLRPAGGGSALIRELIRRLGRLESLDPLAVRCGTLVHRAIRGRALKNLVSGTWLGHPLHPLLTGLPIGCWSSAVVVEGAGGRDAADALVAVGVLTALPTAITGFADWSDTDGEDRRVGLAHAAAVSASISLFATSLLAARTGHRRAGAAFRLAASPRSPPGATSVGTSPSRAGSASTTPSSTRARPAGPGSRQRRR